MALFASLRSRRGAAVALIAAIIPLAAPSLAQTPGFAGAPPQMRRMTEAQYRNTIADIFGADIAVSGRFEPDIRVGGLLAQGTSAVSVSSAGLEQYEALARGVAEQVVDDKHYDKLVGCAPGAGDPKGAACAKRFFETVGPRLYRRPLERAELAEAVAMTGKGLAQVGDFRLALAGALSGMLTAPDFLFRMDHVREGSGGVARLDGWSKATRLSYLLWNTTPDAELMAAAARGDLDTEAGLTRQVDRLIASPRFKNGVRAFFTDFLHLAEIEDVSKDSQIYPSFTSTVNVAAREQTLRTVADVLVDRNADYRELFTTRRMPMNRTLSPLYDVPAPADWYSYEFPKDDPRAGLLTQVSFLAQHSHAGRTSPTLRGKAIREILMCQTIPSPPADVNFTVVQDVNNPDLKTTRARVEAHLNDEQCAGCHRLTDPVGMALEHFDSAGQYRSHENGEPIDAAAELRRIKFDGAAALGAVLADDPNVTKCLVQSTYRYATGRALATDERSVVADLEQSFVAKGRRFPDLMRTIATSPAFYAVRLERPSGQRTASGRSPKGES